MTDLEASSADQVLKNSKVTTSHTAMVMVLLLATLLHAIFLAKAKPLQSANDRSRWCTVWSLVERGTFQIDEIRQRPGWDTIDLVHVDGHFYSTKPPLLTTIVAGITWCVQRVTGWNLIGQTQQVTFLVLLIANIIPFFLSLMAWVAIVERIAENNWTRLFAVITACFGTLITPFLMTLNNHTVATAAVMIALFALLRMLDRTSEHAPYWPYVLCGLASAWAAVNELPAALLVVILFAVSYRSSSRKTLFAFLPAAALPIIALVATNVIATGSWKPFYADYGTDKYRFVIDGVPSYWMQPQGVDRNIDSPWVYFLHCTVGHHGLFSLTPIALLALIGWTMSVRVRDAFLKVTLLAGAFTSAVVIVFYMTRTQNYNYGGVSCALRWALWLTPLWLVAVVPALDRFAGIWAFRSAASLLLAVSVYSAWQPIDNPWRQPWLFQWMQSAGWIDYSEERPSLEERLWTWFPSVPDVAPGEMAWVEFEVARPGTSNRFIRLLGRIQNKGTKDELLELEVRETSDDGITAPRTRKMWIDPQNFRKQMRPSEFMRWLDPDVIPAQQQDDLAFVRGLPRLVGYDLKQRRYMKTALRREALYCKHVAAHVAFATNEDDPPLIYRCDSWQSDAVPFGVVQVEFHISPPDGNGTLFHERWTVHDCWPKVAPFKEP
ncbi:hypothetical protein [Schlesneria paludicola]|uniref:hypothetical protein n=1 Tax=Schlesneria paludicola TaxID=360056 RepID=UPI00029B0038|nr:hypothetical protein [Schlesneria paludicola]